MPADSRALITAPAPRHPLQKYRVCLVCLGNICRSPMAEVVLHSELDEAGLAGLAEVDSAGTGDWHIGAPMDSRARAELAVRGYDGSAHRARQFGPSWFGRYDLVAAMDLANFEDLRAMAPDADARGRIRLFRLFDPALAGWPDGGGQPVPEVPDPYNGTAADYARAFDLVRPAARGLAAQLAELLLTGPETPSGPGTPAGPAGAG